MLVPCCRAGATPQELGIGRGSKSNRRLFTDTFFAQLRQGIQQSILLTKCNVVLAQFVVLASFVGSTNAVVSFFLLFVLKD